LTGICIAGGVAFFFLICILLFLKVRCRSSDKKPNKKELSKQNSNSVEGVEKDPDIIPQITLVQRGKSFVCVYVLVKFPPR
jgi:hypothetical protein